ncbi:hypothetical protein B0681_06355 [Moraxella porci DSM 25326]|uniref:DUF6884 domain-containing protein n=1 Tax=Moraxella porci DSM 25326 TaxID=573983 RepID=A0A1T0CQY8_9GAMM|nr:DUF6884 domain-containing protein [Moraxella porci]OOS24753.1 hypothetical protein B0681_06355 [Moraxella porci DSM 25326]
MKNIVLISCVSKKLNAKCKAQDLYQSPLFIKSLQYAKQLHPDAIYILSAEYHLLELTTEIEPYDKTLKNMKKAEKLAWGDVVANQLSQVCDLNHDKFIILAGNNYLMPLQRHLSHIELPLVGMRIGERMQFLNQQLSSVNL